MKQATRPLRIFISATSEDLGDARRTIKAGLAHVNYMPVERTDFEPDYGTLIDKLTRQIASCDGMIHIVGKRYGGEPDPATVPPGTPRRSHTQWEYHIAKTIGATRKDGFPIYVLLTSDEFPTPPQTTETPDRRALQIAHRDALKPVSAYERVRDHAALERISRAIRLDVERLERGLRETKRWVLWFVVTLALLVPPIVVIALGGGLAEYACRAPLIDGWCKTHGWGGLSTPAQDAAFAAAATSCDGLRRYRDAPDTHPKLLAKADFALRDRIVHQDESWAQQPAVGYPIEIGLGFADPFPEEVQARERSREMLMQRANGYCNPAKATSIYRVAPNRPPARIENVQYHCESYRGQIQCAATADSYCQLDVRSMTEREECHVSPP